MMKTKLLFLPLLFAQILYAQMKSYDFMRKLNKIEKQDYYSLKISPAIMAHSKSFLSDIRIYNIGEKDTVEVPYIQEWLGTTSDEVEVPFELINDSYNEKCCSYVTLKFSEKHPINRIHIEASDDDDNFDKRLKVQGSNDNKEWFTIKDHLRIVGFATADTKFKYTNINFSPSEYTYFRLVMDDDSSPKIKILEATAFDVVSKKGNYTELPNAERKDSVNKKNKTSEIYLDLKQKFIVSHILLLPKKDKDFFRNVNVYYSTGTTVAPAGNFENWALASTGMLRSDDENEIPLPYTQASKFKIEIINHDNQPVEISEIKFFSEDARLVSILPASDNLYLTYGKENDGGGTYDMVHFTDKIPAQMSEADYGDEMTKDKISEEKNPLFKEKMWLWIIMGVIILVILVFSMKMLKSNHQNQ